MIFGIDIPRAVEERNQADKFTIIRDPDSKIIRRQIASTFYTDPNNDLGHYMGDVQRDVFNQPTKGLYREAILSPEQYLTLYLHEQERVLFCFEEQGDKSVYRFESGSLLASILYGPSRVRIPFTVKYYITTEGMNFLIYTHGDNMIYTLGHVNAWLDNFFSVQEFREKLGVDAIPPIAIVNIRVADFGATILMDCLATFEDQLRSFTIRFGLLDETKGLSQGRILKWEPKDTYSHPPHPLDYYNFMLGKHGAIPAIFSSRAFFLRFSYESFIVEKDW